MYVTAPCVTAATLTPVTVADTPTVPLLTSKPDGDPLGVNPPPTPTNTLELPRLNAQTSALLSAIGLDEALSEPLAVV